MILENHYLAPTKQGKIMRERDLADVALFRQRAEEELARRHSLEQTNEPTHTGLCKTIEEHRANIHELEVSRMVLEMQYQELQKAIERAATATALYEFSPAGYFTLESDGRISELNINGANLLGRDRQQLSGSNFCEYLSADMKDTFHDFLQRVFDSGIRQTCEIRLNVNEGNIFYLYLEGFISEDNQQCLLTAIDITERKLSEQAIRTSETRLKQAEIISKTGNWELHLDTQRIFASEGALKIYGIDQEEIYYDDIKKLTLPEYHSHIKLALEALIIENKPFYLHLKIKAADNNEIKDIQSIATYDPEKRIVFGVLQDITQQKRLELRIHESEQFYRSMIEVSPDAIVIVDTKGHLQFASHKAYEIFKIPADYPVKGSPLVGWIAPEMREPTMMRFHGIITGQIASEPFEYKILLLDGSTLWAEIHGSLLKDIHGSVEGLFLICRNVSERKHAEEKIRETEERFRMVFENVFDGIAIYEENDDPFKRRLIECNNQYAIMAGRSREELLAMGFIHHLQISLDKSNNSVRLDSLARQIAYKGSCSWIRPDGKENVIEYIGVPITWRGKSYSIGIDRDVTERVQIEADLIAAKEKAEESDRLKSSFLANMSHEIRTPLNSIIGFSDLMTDPDFDHDQQHQFAQIIHSSGNNLLSIITDIMDISKIEAGLVEVRKNELSVSNLIKSIHRQYSFQALEKGIELMLDPDIPSEEIILSTDETKLRQIIVNLVGNSIKFTEKGYVELGMKKTPDALQIHVKDTGIGISPVHRNKIFERFRQVESCLTRKYGGNGLGLSISKSLVELLGGKLWMESEEGKGSTFYFTLPLEENKS